MRYLYGDSAPFPHSFNFLSTLEAFMAAAARIVQLESESRQSQVQAAAGAAARVKSLEELETFHEAVMRAIQDSAARSTQPQTAEYARQVVEYAAHLVDDAKRSVQTTNEREHAGILGEVDRRRTEIRAALQTFMIRGPLPVLDAAVSMRFDGVAHNTLSATITNPEGIVCSFTLATHAVPAWSLPRKVSDFADGVNLMVGIKRGLFRRGGQPELVHVDEYIVSAFDLTESTAEIHLRRRPNERDALVFTMRRDDGGLQAEVALPSEEGPEALPHPVDPGDKVHLSRLWQNLRSAVEDVLDRRERLLSLRLEGEDVFEHDLSIMLVDRLVRFLAPMVGEIARRSPNPKELSLKVENDQGRREEIYVKKDDLVATLAGLGERERSVFAPLGLMGGSSVPPAGAAGPGGADISFDEWDG